MPLDSWVYPAIDRLMAMGAIDSGFAGMRPWTRQECARLVNEAIGPRGGYRGKQPGARFLHQLQQEFQYEMSDWSGGTNDTFRLESVYSRTEQSPARR